MTRIVAAIAGRLRIRDAALRQTSILHDLQAQLLALPGVLSTRGNAAASSVVVHFDAVQIPLQDMLVQIAAVLDDRLGPLHPSPTEAARTQARGLLAVAQRPLQSQLLNRLAKYSMLFSLFASLALAASGNRRWHATSGAFFVACLGVHLIVHRRRLLR